MKYDIATWPIAALLWCVQAFAQPGETINADVRAEELGVRTFAANYSVKFRGINAGDMDFVLRPATAAEGGNGSTYVYESLAHAHGLAKLFVRHTVREATVFKIEQGRLKPLHYELDDGSKDTTEDTRLDFDWPAQEARGAHKDRPLELPLTAETEHGVQDRMSAQVVVMRLLAAQHPFEKLLFIDRNELKEYSYKKVRDERLKTRIGELDTLVFESWRPESNRISRIWYAPSLGHLPVRGEQERKGKVETVFEIQRIQ